MVMPAGRSRASTRPPNTRKTSSLEANRNRGLDGRSRQVVRDGAEHYALSKGLSITPVHLIRRGRDRCRKQSFVPQLPPKLGRNLDLHEL